MKFDLSVSEALDSLTGHDLIRIQREMPSDYDALPGKLKVYALYATLATREDVAFSKALKDPWSEVSQGFADKEDEVEEEPFRS